MRWDSTLLLGKSPAKMTGALHLDHFGECVWITDALPVHVLSRN
jgi:hypothetical protein